MSNPYPRTAQTSLQRAEKTEQAVSLVREGKSYRQIAEALDISVGTAHNYVKAALKEIPVQEASDLRTIEHLRLEHLWEQVLGRIESCKVEAFDAEGTSMFVYVDVDRHIEAARKLSESKRKLFGLDAPQQVQGTFSVSYTVNGVDPETLT